MRMQSPSSNDSIVKTRFLLPLFINFLMFLEMADCIPTCDEETESLLEFDGLAGFDITSPTWWIQDENNNRVVECGRNERGMCILQTDEGSNPFHRIRHCVPSSGCHLLVARDSYFGVYTEQREHTSFLISRMVASFWRDEMSIEVGSGCSEIAACKNDNNTLLEVFFFRR